MENGCFAPVFDCNRVFATPLFRKHVDLEEKLNDVLVGNFSNMGKWNGANYMIKLVKRLTGAGTMKPDMRFCIV